MTEAISTTTDSNGSVPDSSGKEESDSGTPVIEDQSLNSLPLDQVFGILKNQRRRYVLKYLYAADGPVSLSDVAEQIAAWENDKEVRLISSSERKRVYVGLYQCHLPKMDGADVISFNKPRGIVELGENSDCVYTYLETDDETNESWHTYSMALSIMGSVVLGSALVAQSMIAFPVVDVAIVLVIGALLSYSFISFNRTQGEPDEE